MVFFKVPSVFSPPAKLDYEAFFSQQSKVSERPQRHGGGSVRCLLSQAILVVKQSANSLVAVPFIL